MAGLLLATSATAAELKTGNPKVQSIDSVNFGPEGLLLIGDGKGAGFVGGEGAGGAPLCVRYGHGGSGDGGAALIGQRAQVFDE